MLIVSFRVDTVYSERPSTSPCYGPSIYLVAIETMQCISLCDTFTYFTDDGSLSQESAGCSR